MAITVGGKTIAATPSNTGAVSIPYYVRPWLTQPLMVQVIDKTTSTVAHSFSLPIVPTPVAYEAAARFSRQAAFGPREDIVEHIQQIGFTAYIDEQLSKPAISYSSNPAVYGGSARLQFLQNTIHGDNLLRQRVAWALQSFIVAPSINMEYQSYVPWETTLERDAFGNFRNLMSDIAASPLMGRFLNLAGNAATTNGSEPNQNFAREFMQLFTLGIDQLNDDGTPKHDAYGQTIPTYDQATVAEMSRVFTGWDYPQAQDATYTAYGVDYSLPLTAYENRHDHGSKNIFGVQLPAGQSADADRQAAMDVVFNHPNVPPFVSRLLIQRLVKSNPSQEYVARVAEVFKHDNLGKRGNLAAVVKAILLDPEARKGDTSPDPSDGFIQEPFLLLASAMSFIQTSGSDAQPIYYARDMGQDYWYPATVFGFFSPSYKIPATDVTAPEYQLESSLRAVRKTQLLWGIINYGAGFAYNYIPQSWLFQKFPEVEDFTDAIDHALYAGRMDAENKQLIISFCKTINNPDPNYRLEVAAFLGMNADSARVTQ